MFKTKKVEELEKETCAMAHTPPEALPEEFVQFGLASGGGQLWLVEKPFTLTTRFGPPTAIPAGATVRLDMQAGLEMFQAGRVRPVSMPTIFKAIRHFVTVENGEWAEIERDDVVKITDQAEALRLWRQGYVKPEPEKEVKKDD